MTRREKIEAMLATSPDDVFLNYTYAMERAKEPDVTPALTAFTRVQELDKTYVPAWFQAGQLLARAGQTDEAKAMLQRGIEIAKQTGDEHALGEMTAFLEDL